MIKTIHTKFGTAAVLGACLLSLLTAKAGVLTIYEPVEDPGDKSGPNPVPGLPGWTYDANYPVVFLNPVLGAGENFTINFTLDGTASQSQTSASRLEEPPYIGGISDSLAVEQTQNSSIAKLTFIDGDSGVGALIHETGNPDPVIDVPMNEPGVDMDNTTHLLLVSSIEVPETSTVVAGGALGLMALVGIRRRLGA